MTTLFKKGLVFAVIVIFIGAGVVPSISSDVEQSNNVIKDNDGNIGSCTFDTATFYPTDDSYVSSTIPSGNNGYRINMPIRNGGSGNNWAAQPVIKFDISTIPSETDIVSASLNIFYRDYADNSPSGRELTLYRLTGDWNEETITWDNMPVHHNEITSSIYVPNSPSNWMQWDVTGDVQDFITGQTENYGWIIKDEQYWGGSDIPLMYCNSKEYGENIPYLEIETTPIADVYVDDDYNSSTPGWQYDHFDVIQDGIDAVAESGTVYVFNGTYYENVIVNKTINLTGEDRDSTVIDGGGAGDVVYVSADWVDISGFTIENGGRYGLSLDLVCNCSIIENNITSNLNDDGLNLLLSNYNTISGNIITSNYDDGIELQYSCNYNNIIDNLITSNNEDGIDLFESSEHNIVAQNTILDIRDYGVHIRNSSNNLITKNIVSNCDIGISIEIYVSNSNNNIFYHNELINNTENAYDAGTNFWDNGYPSGGNYWDDYTGVDADGDGIGDTPYDIPGGSNQDLYPLGYFQNIPPIANFTYSPSSPTDLDVIQFTDTSTDHDGVVVNWTWDFDDGNISHLQNPTHQYADDGTYLVNLTVTDNDYEYDSLNRLITVTNVPPVADANGPYTGYIYQLIQFDGSGSYDLDGTIVSYDWNFGDGHTSTGVKPTHGYASDGIFIVTLTVEDDDGDTDTNYSATVIYTHQYPPVADADGPYEGIVGEPIQFYGSATGGSKPYSWYWNFGDGYSSSLQNPIYTYGETGVYTVVLTVTDDNDNSDDDTTTATIYPENVLLADAGGPYSGFVNESVQFYGNAVGGEPPYSWYWDFENGNTSALQNPTHIYDKVGEYDVILTVTDDFGQTDNDMASVTIKSHPPNKPSKPSGPTSGKAGEEYTYSTSTTDHDGDQVYYKWYWGDKINETSGWDGPYDSGDTVTASHIWDEKGDYIIKVKAKDVHGEESPWSDPLPITMPKNKAINPFLLFLERFMERFPILEQILQPIYDKLMSLH